MKRNVAIRKLERTCNLCGCGFMKGDTYYTKRFVFKDEDIHAYTWTRCPRCKYKEDSHAVRFERFKPTCHHPIVELEWSYIYGEAVMQPDHEECRVCGTWV